VDAAGGGVEGELADRDRHPAGALVAEAEDPLVVGHDDEPDILVRAVAEQVRDPVDHLRDDPDAARAAEDVAELLAGPPNRRCVDDRQELLEVLGEDAVEEGRIAVLEGGEADVALEVVGLAAEVLELEEELVVNRQDPVRQQATQPEGVPFGVRKGEILGQQAAAEEGGAGQPDRRRPAGGDRVER
jgi:hypothetical protein